MTFHWSYSRCSRRRLPTRYVTATGISLATGSHFFRLSSTSGLTVAALRPARTPSRSCGVFSCENPHTQTTRSITNSAIVTACSCRYGSVSQVSAGGGSKTTSIAV